MLVLIRNLILFFVCLYSRWTGYTRCSCCVVVWLSLSCVSLVGWLVGWLGAWLGRLLRLRLFVGQQIHHQCNHQRTYRPPKPTNQPTNQPTTQLTSDSSTDRLKMQHHPHTITNLHGRIPAAFVSKTTKTGGRS